MASTLFLAASAIISIGSIWYVIRATRRKQLCHYYGLAVASLLLGASAACRDEWSLAAAYLYLAIAYAVWSWERVSLNKTITHQRSMIDTLLDHQRQDHFR